MFTFHHLRKDDLYCSDINLNSGMGGFFIVDKALHFRIADMFYTGESCALAPAGESLYIKRGKVSETYVRNGGRCQLSSE